MKALRSIVAIGVALGLIVGFSSVPTLFEQDQLFIGNALDVVSHDLCK